MPVGGWNGGHWSPNLNQGASGYNGPDRTPPFQEWTHLTIDEQIQRAREWRAQHSTNLPPGPISTFSSTPARSSSPHALQSRATRPGPVTVAPELSTAPHPDHQRRAQRELTFGGHRTPGQPSATQQFGNDQTFIGQALAPYYPGVPQGVPIQSITTPGPRLDPATAAETDTFAPVAVHPAGVPQQGRSERESSFEEDYKRWESQVVHGQPPVPTSHILVPRVPPPGPPTTPFFVSSPPATPRNDRHTFPSQTPTSHPASSIPLRAFEGLTVQPQSQRAFPETRSSTTAHSVASAVQAPRTEDQTSSLEAPNHPVARDRLSGPAETGAAIESNPVHPEVGDEPSGATTEIGTASDDSAVQRAIRNVEAQIEELEFQPLTAPVKEPSPPHSDSAAANEKTAKNRAKKVRQKENRKAKKVAPATEEPEDHTNPDRMKDDGKRKATEDPASPAAAKRVKHDDSADPPPKPKMAVIPFPEKPAQLEERAGDIQFRVVNNDGDKDSFIIMTGLKCIFQKQLPKMPKDYIARLVYDRTHVSIAIVKKPLEVVGGITYRPFNDRKFAEIVFCAISSDQQVKGYGAHLMAHLKDYVKATSPVMHFLTYADNYAIGYFKKQGFTKEITLDKSVWMGYIKDYEGGTIMQCTMLERVRYLEVGRMLQKQKECVLAKIRAYSNSHVVHQPPKQWKNGPSPIDPMKIEAIKNSGWSPEMDELARQPRHGPNYNQLLHLLNDMQNHQSAWPFLMPVNKDDVHDYYDVIKEPMDLSTMEQKLEMDQYTTPEDFTKDATLIFKNCRQYNSEGTPYTKSANKLEKFMWSKIKEIPEWSHLAENQGK
ncbi:histone acetyltransferase GCN5 [Diaporthe eres]|uniref:histone acetyltransferase n=1 Tax=Diaporthe vaccinii TaxID=105482 RepID=A0ABR4EZK7_9PEZI|nr:histone acetyltransferase GCN5 [Diaporthe eres]